MTVRTRRLLPWIALGVVYLVWGSTYMAIRLVVAEMPPFAAAALRFLVAGAVMAAAAIVSRRGGGRPTSRQLRDYAVVGVLLLAGGNALVMWAETRVPSSIAALIVATVPLWLTFLDGFRPGGEAWTGRVWAGTAVGLVGVGLVARPESAVEPGHWPAVAALLAAPVCWALGSLYAKSLTRRLPLAAAAAVEMLAGSLVLVVESSVLGEDLGAFGAASGRAWLALAYLAVFGSLVAFTAFVFCLNELPAPTVGTYAYVNPVVAVILGSVFLAEPISGRLVAGAAMILGAVVLTTLKKSRAVAPPPPSPQERAGDAASSATLPAESSRT
jgi:drug/metabolite transporter (DMT)-like permease